MATGNFARAETILSELRATRNSILQTSRAVKLSVELTSNFDQSVDISTNNEGGLLMDHVLAEAEKVAVMIGKMNQLTRELTELQERQQNLGIDLNACQSENIMAASCLQEIFLLLPQPEEAVHDEFIEEFDQLLAQEKEHSKRHQYIKRMTDILNFSRTPASTPYTPMTSPVEATAPKQTDSSKSSATILTAVVLPVAGGLIGGLIFGPAGLLLGFKSVAMLGACAAVGAGVGITAGTGIHLSLKPTTNTTNSTSNNNTSS